MAKWKPVSRHAYNYLDLAMSAGFSLVLCLVLAGVGAILVVIHSRPTGTGYLYVLGTGLLLLAVLALLIPLLAWHRRLSLVRLYEEGLKWTRGGVEHKYRWDDVTEVYRTEIRRIDAQSGAEAGRQAFIHLVFSDGSKAGFRHTEMHDYDEFASIVLPAVAARQLPAALEAMDEEGVDFGPVRLDRKGLTIHGTHCPWSKVEEITAENGSLCIYGEDEKKRSVPLSEVPNYQLFFSLILELIHEKKLGGRILNPSIFQLRLAFEDLFAGGLGGKQFVRD